MKKTLLTMLMVASYFGVVNAQLLVDENGKTGVGIETTNTLNSQLTVNSLGESGVTMYVNSQDYTGLKINRTTSSGSGYGIYVTSRPSGFENYGIYGRSVLTSGTRTAYSSFGVAGVANGANNGYNFGVAGFVDEVYGAGVFGSSSASLGGISVSGRYAGLFHGDVYVTGTVSTGTLLTPSDYRLKNEIKSLSNDCLDKVLGMNIVEFKYKQRESTVAGEQNMTKEKKASWYDEDSPFLKNKHYGFIAQELKEIYPDLVVEGKDGYLGVNYIEIIPLLVRSIQELNAKVEQYENASAPTFKAQARTADATGIEAVVTTLYQNTPNPFTESTLIQCDIAESVANANLYIYNMNGEQITEFVITERGSTSVTIDGGSLSAGMYLYALVADGQVIDTKRMILTK